MKSNQNFISKNLDHVRGHVRNPLVLAGLLSLGGAGLGMGLWENLIQTGGSLGRYPIRKMTGMSNEEYDEAMKDLAENSKYRYVIPAAVGLALGGTYLGLRATPNQEGYGLTQWAAKTASLHKKADEFWTYGGYVPEIDWNAPININKAKTMFTNAPSYLKNMGNAILNRAEKDAGYANVTNRDVYDSTAQKMKSKLSWEGVTNIAANTMIANATAHLFTSGLSAVMPLSDTAKRNLIDAGTWGTFIASVLS